MRKSTYKGFKIHLDKYKNRRIQYYIGSFFILLGSLSFLEDISNVMSAYAVIGVLYILTPKLMEKFNYHVFTDRGILKPRYLNLAEPKFLAYEDITHVNFVVGDYVFKNMEIEFRFPKELLNEKEIAFLEEKYATFKAKIDSA